MSKSHSGSWDASKSAQEELEGSGQSHLRQRSANCTSRGSPAQAQTRLRCPSLDPSLSWPKCSAGWVSGLMHLFSCSIAGNRPPAGSCGWDPACPGCSGVLRGGCCLHEVPGCVGAAQWPWARAGTAGHHHRLVMCPPVWGRGQETPSTSPPASPRGTQQEGLNGDPQRQQVLAPSCPTARPGYRPRLSDYRNVFFFSLHTMDRPSWELLAFPSELTNGLGRALARSWLPPPRGLGSGAPVLPLGCGDTAAPGRPRCKVWEMERVVRARCEEQEGRRKSFNTEQVSGEPKLCCFLLIMKYS